MKRLGFTIIEVIVTMGIIAVLLALSSINLLGAKNKVSLNSSVNVFVTDVAQQQLKAMVGDTEGRGGNPDNYGVYFDPDGTKYWLIHGAGYGNPDDFAVSLGDNIVFSPIPVPATIIFNKGSGETGSTSSITIKNTITNEKRIVSLNQYGIITQIINQ